MVSSRHLGAVWFSVHGPAGAGEQWAWMLERGFAGVLAGPTPRPVDWAALAAARHDLPVHVPAVRVFGVLEAEPREALAMTSAKEAERRAAIAPIREAVARAATLGAPRILLDPGIVAAPGERGPVDLGDPGAGLDPERARAQLARRNAGLERALDAVCRFLWEVTRTFEDVEICLTPSRSVFGLGEPDALAAIFEDLGSKRLRYWHDTAIAARREELLETEQGAWLERFASRLAGYTVGDTADGLLYLPPGAGPVDYPLLASYLRRTGRPQPAVLELDPSVDANELPGAHAFLDKYGL